MDETKPSSHPMDGSPDPDTEPATGESGAPVGATALPENATKRQAGRRPQARRPDLDTVYSINQDGSRNFIHPHDVKGRWQVRKRLLWVALIAIYLALPWVSIDGKPAMLLDIQSRQAHLLGWTFNASDFYLAFFVLTGVGFTLFVVSSLLGRVWCGFGCPQTVFLEGVYRRVERLFDGPAPKRIALQSAPWNARKVLRRSAKYAVYLAISLWITHTFLGYFMPARELLHAVTGPPSAHPTAFTFMVVSTIIVYANFAWFREQLCIVICPYGRYQGTLYDTDTVIVGYDALRGEPRGVGKERDGLGDCVHCFKCVAVCPTGIDIRNGNQLECIGCTNCIDACDEVMDRVGKPRGLVRFDSQNGFEGRRRRFLRPRLFVYGFLFLLGCTVFAVAASRRVPFDAMLLRNLKNLGGQPYVLNEAQGTITNVYSLRLGNKLGDTRTFSLRSEAPEGVDIIVSSPSLEIAPGERVDRPIVTIMKAATWDRAKDAWIVVEVQGGEGEEPLIRRLKIPLAGPR